MVPTVAMAVRRAAHPEAVGAVVRQEAGTTAHPVVDIAARPAGTVAAHLVADIAARPVVVPVGRVVAAATNIL